MNNEEILKENNGKKFDIILMNPPYGAKEDGNYLDIKFTNKCIEICDKVISIQPAKLTSNAGIYKTFFDQNIIEDIELLDPYNTFKINPFGAYKYVGIFNIDPNRTFDKLHLTLNNSEYNIENTFEERSKFINEQNWDKNIRELIDKKEPLRKELFKKYNSMVNDGHGFIYEENRLQRGRRFNVTKKDNHALDRVKRYLKDDKYKYCIYKGSGNHSYDKPQEWLHQDVDKLFKGQVCWLTNSENVKNNIIYWMETPIFDLWRLYYFNHSKYTVGCLYGHLPALNFEMNEKEFKDYVDSLNNFTKEEIQILKDNNIHNANKL